MEQEKESGFIIRPMRPADIEAVARLERLVFSDPWPMSAYVEELLFTPKTHYFVLERPLPSSSVALPPAWGARPRSSTRWEVIGLVGLRLESSSTEVRAHITNLAIHPTWQRQGWGRRLLRRALEAAQPYAPHRVVLEVRTTNEAAIALYRSEGFTIVRRMRRYYRNGEDAYLMEKALPKEEGSINGQGN